MSVFKPLFGKDVLINAALYVAHKLPIGQRRMHKVFKILWFADLSHLKKYGRTITGDTYIAMTNGPVPSVLYDEIKDCSSPYFRRFDNESGKGFIDVLAETNEDFLSDTDKEEMDISFDTYKDMDFGELSQKSHNSAWKAAGLNNSIRLNEILDEIGADEKMRQYITENENIRRVI